MLSSYLQRLQSQPKNLERKAPIVRVVWRARWGSRGVSVSRCRSSVAFLSLLPHLCFLLSKTFHQDGAAIRSLCILPIFFASQTTHPPSSLSLFLPSNPFIPLCNWAVERGWHFRGAGVADRAALMKQRCRVLCGKGWRGGWVLSWDRKQPPLDDETGALFVYVLGLGGEVLVALEETHKPTQSSLPGLTCGRRWKVNGHLESLCCGVTASWGHLKTHRAARGRTFGSVVWRNEF